MVKIDGDKRKMMEQDSFEEDKYGFSNTYPPRNFAPPPPVTRPPPTHPVMPPYDPNDPSLARPGYGEPFTRVEIRNLDITVTTQEIRY